MAVNEWATSASHVAEMAAAATQQYCLFWWDWWPMCMTKTEWSGWLQAVGSVIAILASGFLVRYQLNRGLELQRRAAISRIRTFVAFVSSHVDHFATTSDYSQFEMRRQGALMGEQIAIASTISAELLHIEWIAAFEATRSIAVQCKVLMDLACEQTFDPQSFKKLTQELASKMPPLEKVVVGAHPGISNHPKDWQ